MNAPVHGRIEAIAGAIALGEATDAERREYREHIAACERCLGALGGEHEIERVAATVTAARECEVWQPKLRDVIANRARRRGRIVRASFALTALCAAIWFGVHVAMVNGVARLTSTASVPAVLNAGATRIALQRHSAHVSTPLPLPARRMIVEHNVVQIARAPVPEQPVIPVPKAGTTPRAATSVTVHAPAQPPAFKTAQSDIPVWRRGGERWRTVATTTTTSLSESAPQTLTHNAESIQLVSPHVTRDAMPLGGETAINPQPAMIAYDEGAEGTSMFEVLVDERGVPTKCVIIKSAGYAVLDSAVCKAAMQARYSPKTIDGRPVAGMYRDAFTFRMSSPNQSIEGIPKPIP